MLCSKLPVFFQPTVTRPLPTVTSVTPVRTSPRTPLEAWAPGPPCVFCFFVYPPRPPAPSGRPGPPLNENSISHRPKATADPRNQALICAICYPPRPCREKKTQSDLTRLVGEIAPRLSRTALTRFSYTCWSAPTRSPCFAYDDTIGAKWWSRWQIACALPRSSS